MLYYKIDILQALKDKGYSTYRLRKERIIGEAQLTKIRAGDIASKETLNKICEILETEPGEFLGYKKEN